MAQLSSIEQLLAVWSEVALAPDPLAALAASGHVISPSLANQLTRSTPHRLGTEQRADLLQRISVDRELGAPFANGAQFAIRKSEHRAPRVLPPGEFDVVASLRLEVVDQLLAGLFATRVLPHELPIDTESQAIIALLRELSDDIPDQEGLELGGVRLPAPPTAMVGPGGAVRLAQPLRLDIDLIRDSIPRFTTVTSLSAVYYYDARPEASPLPNDPETIFIQLDIPLGLDTEEFEISADSLIQPRGDEACATFTAAILPLLTLGIRTRLSGQQIAVSPDLRLPFDKTVPVHILVAKAGTAATESGSGALHVGIMVGVGDGAIAPAVPERVTVESDIFGRSAITAVVSVHEATLQRLAEASVGALQRKANDKVPWLTVAVDSATAELRPPDSIQLMASARIVNFCGPGPVNFIDLDFDAVLDLEASVYGETLRFEGDPEIDLDNTDLALCLISSAADVASLQIGDVVIVLGGLIFGKIWIETSDKLSEKSHDFNGALLT